MACPSAHLAKDDTVRGKKDERSREEWRFQLSLLPYLIWRNPPHWYSFPWACYLSLIYKSMVIFLSSLLSFPCQLATLLVDRIYSSLILSWTWTLSGTSVSLHLIESISEQVLIIPSGCQTSIELLVAISGTASCVYFKALEKFLLMGCPVQFTHTSMSSLLVVWHQEFCWLDFHSKLKDRWERWKIKESRWPHLAHHSEWPRKVSRTI